MFFFVSYHHLVKQNVLFIIEDVDFWSLISTHQFFKENLGHIHFVYSARLMIKSIMVRMMARLGGAADTSGN